MIIIGGYKLDLSKLSYTVQVKSSKVFKLKEIYDKKRISLNLPIGISGLLLFYVFMYLNRYISYLNDIFENNNSKSAIKKLDLIILIIVIATISFLYILLKEFKKAKDNYDKLRIDLIKTINSEFCTCRNTCVCKDDYIKDMEKEGIDLIFI